jgi:hypothetical protein
MIQFAMKYESEIKCAGFVLGMRAARPRRVLALNTSSELELWSFMTHEEIPSRSEVQQTCYLNISLKASFSRVPQCLAERHASLSSHANNTLPEHHHSIKLFFSTECAVICSPTPTNPSLHVE